MSGNPNRSKGFTWGRARERSAEESLSVSVFPHVKEKVCLISPIISPDEILHLNEANSEHKQNQSFSEFLLVLSTRVRGSSAYVCWFLLANLSEFLNAEISLLDMSWSGCDLVHMQSWSDDYFCFIKTQRHASIVQDDTENMRFTLFLHKRTFCDFLSVGKSGFLDFLFGAVFSKIEQIMFWTKSL